MYPANGFTKNFYNKEFFTAKSVNGGGFSPVQCIAPFSKFIHFNQSINQSNS